jgi:U3 small nucleolar RNA-associated protein 22
LKESKLDYGKALKDVDGHLHQIKGIVDSIPAHDPLPVGTPPRKNSCFG